MEDITPEAKFRTAVEIIRNLPKSGSFQPSNDVKLKFYSYYKQATEGPCEIPKPGFWDIVNRAKWDAWKGLGNMSKEEAMQHYVDEFFKVAENTPAGAAEESDTKPFREMMEPLIKYVPKELEHHLRVNGNTRPDDLNHEEDTHYTPNGPTESYKLLKQVYGNNTLSQSKVFVCHQRFKDGVEEIQDYERRGRPMTVCMDENIWKVASIIHASKDDQANSQSHWDCRNMSVDSDRGSQHASESVEINNPKAKYFKGKDVGSKKTDIPDRTTEGTPDSPSAVNGHNNMNGSNDSDSEEFSDTFDKVNEDSDEDLVSTATVVEETSCNPSISNAKGANIVHVRGGGDQRSSARDSNSPVSGASGNRSHRQSHQGRGGLDSTSLNVPSSSITGSSGGNRRSGGNVVLESPADVSEQLALAVIKLQHTMDQVVSRLDSLETLLQERRSNPCRQVSRMNNSFWSIFGISPRAALLILGWPFIAHWLLYMIEKRRRR